MKLFVCWSTADPSVYDHACGKAHTALKDAGHDPEVKHAFGWTKLPDFLNNTSGRKEVRQRSGGNDMVVSAGNRRAEC